MIIYIRKIVVLSVCWPMIKSSNCLVIRRLITIFHNTDFDFLILKISQNNSLGRSSPKRSNNHLFLIACKLH